MKASERLKSLREYKRMTQFEFADAVGLSRASYQRWEQGRVEIPIEYARKVASYVSVPLTYIYGEDFEPLPSRFEIMFNALPAEDKDDVVEFVAYKYDRYTNGTAKSLLRRELMNRHDIEKD